jgi:hypothetical protein
LRHGQGDVGAQGAQVRAKIVGRRGVGTADGDGRERIRRGEIIVADGFEQGVGAIITMRRKRSGSRMAARMPIIALMEWPMSTQWPLVSARMMASMSST